MTKNEFIDKLADNMECSKTDAAKIFSAFFNTISEVLASGESLNVVGFGTFEVKKREARNGRNPKTGESILIPAKKVPAIKFSKSLKEKVAGV